MIAIINDNDLDDYDNDNDYTYKAGNLVYPKLSPLAAVQLCFEVLRVPLV